MPIGADIHSKHVGACRALLRVCRGSPCIKFRHCRSKRSQCDCCRVTTRSVMATAILNAKRNLRNPARPQRNFATPSGVALAKEESLVRPLAARSVDVTRMASGMSQLMKRVVRFLWGWHSPALTRNVSCSLLGWATPTCIKLVCSL